MSALTVFLAHMHAREKSNPWPLVVWRLLTPKLLVGTANIWNTVSKFITPSVYSCPIRCLPERSTHRQARLLAIAYQLLDATLKASYYAACSELGVASDRLTVSSSAVDAGIFLLWLLVRPHQLEHLNGVIISSPFAEFAALTSGAHTIEQ